MNLDSQYSFNDQYPEVGTPEIRKKFAEELRSAREFNEAGIDQLRSITKINNQYLELLEKGIWSFLPPVYVKLFITAYADAVEIHSKEFQQRLDDAFEIIKPTIKTVVSDEFRDQNSAPTGKRKTSQVISPLEKNRSLIFYGIISIIVLIIVGWYLFKPRDNSEISKQEIPQRIETKQFLDNSKVQEMPEVEETFEDSIAHIITDPVISEQSIIEGLSFHLVSLGTCYVKIEHLDSIMYDRTLWPSNEIIKTLPEPIKLTLGNAPLVRVIVNGDTLSPFSEDRRVRVLNIDSGGIIG